MTKLYRHAILSTIGGFVALFGVIFVPAWTLDYWQGWVFFATLGISTSVPTVYIAIHDPKLFERRVNMGPAAEKTRTQKILTTIGMPVFVLAFVVMVFDHRFRWSPAVPAWVSIAGDILIVLGLYVYYLVTKENSYAGATVDVVEGQTVCSTGLYAILATSHVRGRAPGFPWRATCAGLLVGSPRGAGRRRRIRLAASGRRESADQ